VIAGDSNMSEYVTFLKVGTTALLLQMLEADFPIRDMSLENPIRAIRDISHDLDCKRQVRLANGREMSALDVQKEYLDRATKFSETYGLPPLLEKALGMWQHVLRGLEKDPLSLSRELDWVTKLTLIEQFRERHDLPLGHPRVALVDLAYHDVNTRRGLYYLLARRGRVDRIVTDEDIARAVQEAPQTTRARLRGEFIRAAKRKKRDFTVDWVHLKLNDQAQRTVLCKDPFRSHDQRVDKLIESL